MAQSAGLLCYLLAVGCPPMPDVAGIQTADESEASAGSKLHDKGLKVLDAKCHDQQSGQFLCEVTFISTNDESERLYFDVVAVKRVEGKGWELKSGLCKR